MHCSTSNQKEVFVRAFYLFLICKLCGLEMRTGWAESNVELQLDAGSGSTLHAHRHDFLLSPELTLVWSRATYSAFAASALSGSTRMTSRSSAIPSCHRPSRHSASA